MKVLFYPHRLVNFSEAFGILRLLGIPHTSDIKDPDVTVAFYWNVNTVSEYPKELQELEDSGIPVFNKITDVSKVKVDAVYKSVFGKSLMIDPTKHRGNCVKKTNTQAIHDGVMQMCPCSPQPGFIYQKIIDSRFNNDEVYDLRTVIVGGKIVHLTILIKSVGECFGRKKDGNKVTAFRCVHGEPKDWFTSEEMMLIEKFADEFNVDYAHFDIVRNNYDGQIYIIDVNNISAITSYAPLKDGGAALRKVTEAFRVSFLKI